MPQIILYTFCLNNVIFNLLNCKERQTCHFSCNKQSSEAASWIHFWLLQKVTGIFSLLNYCSDTYHFLSQNRFRLLLLLTAACQWMLVNVESFVKFTLLIYHSRFSNSGSTILSQLQFSSSKTWTNLISQQHRPKRVVLSRFSDAWDSKTSYPGLARFSENGTLRRKSVASLTNWPDKRQKRKMVFFTLPPALWLGDIR